jgi:hypothetical protein
MRSALVFKTSAGEWVVSVSSGVSDRKPNPEPMDYSNAGAVTEIRARGKKRVAIFNSRD